MTHESFKARFDRMSAAQDEAASMVTPLIDGDLMSRIKLCGGTALSRFHLLHRISYDLDFFVPTDAGFNAQLMANRIAPKVRIHGLEITHGSEKADQLHFFVPIANGDPIKISIVEDMYADVFPPMASGLVIAGREIMTESVSGLYHRKLRTVVGWAESGAEIPSGGRQTARDMFDLFVLSKSVMPLKPFIDSLPYPFPLDAFCYGMAMMPWFDLEEELRQTIAAPQWREGCDVDVVRNHLFVELGIVELQDFDDQNQSGGLSDESMENGSSSHSGSGTRGG